MSEGRCAQPSLAYASGFDYGFHRRAGVPVLLFSARQRHECDEADAGQDDSGDAPGCVFVGLIDKAPGVEATNQHKGNRGENQCGSFAFGAKQICGRDRDQSAYKTEEK